MKSNLIESLYYTYIGIPPFIYKCSTIYIQQSMYTGIKKIGMFIAGLQSRILECDTNHFMMRSHTIVEMAHYRIVSEEIAPGRVTTVSKNREMFFGFFHQPSAATATATIGFFLLLFSFKFNDELFVVVNNSNDGGVHVESVGFRSSI